MFNALMFNAHKKKKYDFGSIRINHYTKFELASSKRLEVIPSLNVKKVGTQTDTDDAHPSRIIVPDGKALLMRVRN